MAERNQNLLLAHANHDLSGLNRCLHLGRPFCDFPLRTLGDCYPPGPYLEAFQRPGVVLSQHVATAGNLGIGTITAKSRLENSYGRAGWNHYAIRIVPIANLVRLTIMPKIAAGITSYPEFRWFSRLFGEARRSEEWQRAVAQINRELLAGSDTDGVLQLIAHWARRIAAADVAVIGFADKYGTLVVEVADGQAGADLVGSPLLLRIAEACP